MGQTTAMMPLINHSNGPCEPMVRPDTSQKEGISLYNLEDFSIMGDPPTVLDLHPTTQGNVRYECRIVAAKRKATENPLNKKETVLLDWFSFF
jgi:hypothetical protein